MGSLEGLQQVSRACRYGHGPLQAVPGAWLLAPAKGQAQAPGLLSSLQPYLNYAVQLHTCKTCGYMEMSDFPAPEA